MTLEVASSIAHLRSEDWNALCGGHPFLRHEFLNALHEIVGSGQTAIVLTLDLYVPASVLAS